ncbi:hypothetical protein BKA70DRAFT_1162059 [Coprinopsis sp. MPI-PUGE-AT-0042]|nr:hypothetical protein BKA70DRAFT_1162059 [Coprinopsis sp. MPI-PUGE-AT-0042]
MATEPSREKSTPNFIRATRLPTNPYTDNETWRDAYNACLTLEQRADPARPVEIIHARLLGYLLIYAFDDEGRDVTSIDILRCAGEKGELNELARRYRSHLLGLFRQRRPRTPPIPYQGNPSYQHEDDFLSAPAEAQPTNHLTAKRAAMERDGFKCLFKGAFDRWYIGYLDREKKPIPPQHMTCERTYAVHIFPSLSLSCDARKPEWADTVYKFAHIDVFEELNGPKGHNLGNVLTLSTSLGIMFQGLQVWLEEDPDATGPNQYTLHADLSYVIKGLPHRLSILNHQQELDLPLPDPRYLKLHASLCRISLLSGASEYMEELKEEHERISVLKSDGSSNDYLDMRLRDALLGLKTRDEEG